MSDGKLFIDGVEMKSIKVTGISFSPMRNQVTRENVDHLSAFLSSPMPRVFTFAGTLAPGPGFFDLMDRTWWDDIAIDIWADDGGRTI